LAEIAAVLFVGGKKKTRAAPALLRFRRTRDEQANKGFELQEKWKNRSLPPEKNAKFRRNANQRNFL